MDAILSLQETRQIVHWIGCVVRFFLCALVFLVDYGFLLVACVCCRVYVAPRNPSCIVHDGVYVYSCDSACGRFVVADSKSSLQIKCNDFVLGDIESGVLAVDITAKSASFVGKYKGIDVDCALSAGGTRITFAESADVRKFKGEYVATDAQSQLDFKCEYADPGVEDFRLSIGGGRTLSGKFSGKFYKREFGGSVQGTGWFGTGMLYSDLCPQTKLKWQRDIVWLNSDVLFGVVDLVKQTGKFHFHKHYVDFEPHNTHIYGPEVCMSVYTRTNKTGNAVRIMGSRMIYAGDLLSAMIWAESFKEGKKQTEYRVSCDNFHQHDMCARAYSKPSRVCATFYNNRSRLIVKRVKHNLQLYCSDLDVFKGLLGRFVVTHGQAWISATKSQRVWSGSIKIQDAHIASNYQSQLGGVSKLWLIDASWSFDGRTLRIDGVHMRNRDACVLLDICIAGMDKQQITVAGSIYKRNGIARISELLMSEKYTQKLFGSKFSVTRKSGQTKFATSRANVLLGWVSFLPV